jgi:exopolysaccharide biosynthesis protein
MNRNIHRISIKSKSCIIQKTLPGRTLEQSTNSNINNHNLRITRHSNWLSFLSYNLQFATNSCRKTSLKDQKNRNKSNEIERKTTNRITEFFHNENQAAQTLNKQADKELSLENEPRKTLIFRITKNSQGQLAMIPTI